MKHSRKKKRRSQPPKQDGNGCAENSNVDSNEETIINSLVEAFLLASIEEAKTAYEKADGDPNKAAEILSGLSHNSEAFQTSSCSSSQSSGLDSSSSEGFTDSNASSDSFSHGGFKGNKGKKVVAATGTISNVLGKDYVSSSPRKDVLVKQKGCVGSKVDIEEAEQFLCSMLGDGCELSMGVVKDVLCELSVPSMLSMLFAHDALVYFILCFNWMVGLINFEIVIFCFERLFQLMDGLFQSLSSSIVQVLLVGLRFFRLTNAGSEGLKILGIILS